MIGRDLRRSERILIRLLQVHKLVPVEKILECVEVQKRLRAGGVERNLALIVKDQDLVPRKRLKALARTVKFNLLRTRDKMWASQLVSDRVVAPDAVARCLSRQLSSWEESHQLKPLADLLASEEKVPVSTLARYIAASEAKIGKPRRPDEDEDDTSIAEPLLVLDLEAGDDEEFAEPISDSDSLPPDDDE